MKNNKKKPKPMPPIGNMETQYQMLLVAADAIGRELEQLRIRGDALAVALATKSRSNEVHHSLIKDWWEVRA